MRGGGKVVSCFCCMVWMVFLVIPRAHAASDDTPQQFRLSELIEPSWGRLVSVYDQPTYQRFTFESDTQITVLHLGLTWDNREALYRPNVRQVIHMMKKRDTYTVTPSGNIRP